MSVANLGKHTLEDMFQLIVMPQGIEKVKIQLKDSPIKVYAIGAKLFLSKVPIEQAFFWTFFRNCHQLKLAKPWVFQKNILEFF